MATRKVQTTGQSFRLIPEFREEIDVRKLCQALIIAAREKSENKADIDRKKDTEDADI